MRFKYLLLSGALLLFAAFVIRWRIFNRLEDDRIAGEMLDETFLTTNDFLWIRLFRKRERINPRHRPLILTYFWLKAGAALFVVAALVVHQAAA